ncbi:hypothetical protein AAVH_21361 [Aphelenchoides avenae]|nr:hypothetical protein AAVH_21361 [Aphelenchus avenae]
MDKANRLEKRLRIALEEKNFYEAHQIYRTIYYRLIEAQSYDALLRLLFDGCHKFIDAGEYTSAIDLAELYVETLQKGSVPVSDAVLDEIATLFTLLPAVLPTDVAPTSNAGPPSDRRNKFLNMAFKWTQQVAEKRSQRTKGHPGLHRRFAEALAKEVNLEQARGHYLLADDPEGFANFLIDLQQRCGVESEYDLFIAQAVLHVSYCMTIEEVILFEVQVLCHKKLSVANQLFQQYTLRHPLVASPPPYRSPLLNFIWLMLLSLQMKNLVYYTELIEKYRPTIDRDPCYKHYLDKIGQLYLGLPPPQRESGGGLFSMLMKGLAGKKDTSAEDADLLSDDEEEEFADVDEEHFISAASSADALNETGSTATLEAGPSKQTAAPVSQSGGATASRSAAQESADMDLD